MIFRNYWDILIGSFPSLGIPNSELSNVFSTLGGDFSFVIAQDN